jgi:CBS domain-containing protein
MFQSIRVRDYMARDLITLTPETEVLHAIHLLAENNISGAPVVDEDGRLVGMLSERDFMRVVLEAGYYKSYGGRVDRYMTKNVVTIDPDESIMELAKRFMEIPYRRYPVMENDRLIGQISRRDVIRALGDLW